MYTATNSLTNLCTNSLTNSITNLCTNITNPATNYQAEWVLDIKAWVEANLQDRLHSDGLDPGLELDNDNIVLMGHSSGAHVVVEFLKHHCDLVRGQILFSPVDGVDPFGLIDNFAITPGQPLNYNLPSLLLMTGLDSVPGTIAGDFTPACAPEEMSNLRQGRLYIHQYL